MGKKINSTKTKEEVIQKILIKQEQLRRPLKQSDFTKPTINEIGMGLIRKYWKNFNNMKIELNLVIVQEDMSTKHKNKDELLLDLQNFINELGRLPNSYEIDNNKNMLNRTAYNHAFGGISNAFKLLGYTPNKKSIAFHVNNDKIKQIYKDFFEEVGFVPSFEFCKKIYKLPSPRTVTRRLNCTWNEFVKKLGYEPNKKIATTNTMYAEDGTLCFSSAECFIHNILIKKDVEQFQKETFYNEILSSEKLKVLSGYKRFDWTFKYDSRIYLVEYFGLMDKENYVTRHDEKLELLRLDDKLENLITIYPRDLKDIDKIFNFIPNKELNKKEVI